jgi:hypothetical protein
MFYSGVDVVNQQAVVNYGEVLTIAQVNQGEYGLEYQLQSSDPCDYFTLAENSGQVSVFVNQAWHPVEGSVRFPNTQDSELLRIRVDSSKASFSMQAGDGYDCYPGDTLTHPKLLVSLGSEFNFDMGNTAKEAWELGRITPQTSLTWMNGRVEQGTRSIQITENIGGDDVSDYLSFTLAKPATVGIQTEGAIAQVLNGNATAVIVDSNGFYESTFKVRLPPGHYFLGFSSESSIPNPLTSTVIFQVFP